MKNQTYFLLMPKSFGRDKYLHFCHNSQEYFMHDTTEETEFCKCQFTQSQIDEMPFDTKFFNKQEDEK